MLTLTYGDENATLAKQLEADLSRARLKINAQADPAQQVLLVLVSPRYAQDKPVQDTVFTALDAGHYIVPILTQNAALPKPLDHLPHLDFSENYQFDALLEYLGTLGENNTHFPMKVLTPRQRRRNRRVGAILAFVAIGMFVLAVWGITAGLVGFPEEEYEQVETQEIATINAFVDDYLPRSTQEAAQFAATVDAVPTRLRPFVIQTATALWGGDPAVQATALPPATATSAP